MHIANVNCKLHMAFSPCVESIMVRHTSGMNTPKNILKDHSVNNFQFNEINGIQSLTLSIIL